MSPREKSLWHMVAAPVVWALHFVCVYGWTAVTCANTGAAADARVGVAALTVIALAIIVFVAWRAWRQWDYADDWDYEHEAPTDEHRREFLGHAGWLLAIVSAVGVVYVALPAVFIGSCL